MKIKSIASLLLLSPLLTFIPNPLSYAQLDVSGATNLTPEEKQSALSSSNLLTSNITTLTPQSDRTTEGMLTAEETSAHAQSDNNETASNPIIAKWESDVRSQVELSKKTPDKAFLMIHSDSGWSATIFDSGFDSATKDGSGNSIIEFECKPDFLSTYSLSAQKQSESGYLFLTVIQNGHYIDDASTNAAYGVVSLSDECDKPG